MLILINTVANVVVFAGTFWLLFTHRVPTRTGGAAILCAVAFGAFANLVSSKAGCAVSEIMLNVAVAAAMLWAFWHLEGRRWFSNGPKRRFYD